jgi:DMSO reductase family type II enzyme chaperone
MNATIDNAQTLAGGYLAMAQVFSYPNTDTWQRMTEIGLVAPGLQQEELEAEFLAAFEVGRNKPPVPLFEGLNRTDQGREGILEDVQRFYEFFDAKPNETDREYPDHLSTELEFLAWLCMREQAAEQQGGDADSFRRAAKDFLDRHVAAWVPEFRQRLEATETAYGEYAATLDELVRQHRTLLEEQLDGLEA